MTHDTPTRIYLCHNRNGHPRLEEVGPDDIGAEAWVPEVSGVRVKALEWKEYPAQGFWRADTPLGEYSVGFDDGWLAQLEGVEFWEWEAPEDPRCYSGPEAGMLACKADYEARILAALEPVAQPEPEPGELLNCPFCGEKAHVYTSQHFTDLDSIGCANEECAAQPSTDYVRAERAIAAWNRRATREPGTEPTPGQFTTMCLAIEDVVTGRGFDVDPWQPIETAPRDGTWFLAGTAGAEWQRPRVVRFYDDYDRFPMHEDMRPWSVAPTHWQPITKPGEATSAIPEAVKAYLRNALMVGGWRGEGE